MKSECSVNWGTDGIVIGILNPDGTLNMEQMKALVEEAGDMGITLHRAFDVCRDPYEAMEQCISLGIDTILTSGQKSSAWEGRDLIKDLVKKSAGRIEILAGGRYQSGEYRKTGSLHKCEGIPYVRKSRD